jgi:hypothetical protein
MRHGEYPRLHRFPEKTAPGTNHNASSLLFLHQGWLPLGATPHLPSLPRMTITGRLSGDESCTNRKIVSIRGKKTFSSLPKSQEPRGIDRNTLLRTALTFRADCGYVGTWSTVAVDAVDIYVCGGKKKIYIFPFHGSKSQQRRAVNEGRDRIEEGTEARYYDCRWFC